MTDCRKCQRFSACYFDSDDCIGFMPQPQTNADRIRSMSDDELAEWMNDGWLDVAISKSMVRTEQWLDWLRKGVEDG